MKGFSVSRLRTQLHLHACALPCEGTWGCGTKYGTNFPAAHLNLKGRVKTGHAWSLQNRPTVWPRTWFLFIPLSPDQASPFWFSSSADRISGCARDGVDDRAWR